MAKPYIFGVHNGWLNDREVAFREAIAAEHGAVFMDNVKLPDGTRSWFETDGASDSRTTVEARVLAALEQEEV